MPTDIGIGFGTASRWTKAVPLSLVILPITSEACAGNGRAMMIRASAIIQNLYLRMRLCWR